MKRLASKYRWVAHTAKELRQELAIMFNNVKLFSRLLKPDQVETYDSGERELDRYVMRLTNMSTPIIHTETPPKPCPTYYKGRYIRLRGWGFTEACLHMSGVCWV